MAWIHAQYINTFVNILGMDDKWLVCQSSWNVPVGLLPYFLIISWF